MSVTPSRYVPKPDFSPGSLGVHLIDYAQKLLLSYLVCLPLLLHLRCYRSQLLLHLRCDHFQLLMGLIALLPGLAQLLDHLAELFFHLAQLLLLVRELCFQLVDGLGRTRGQLLETVFKDVIQEQIPRLPRRRGRRGRYRPRAPIQRRRCGSVSPRFLGAVAVDALEVPISEVFPRPTDSVTATARLRAEILLLLFVDADDVSVYITPRFRLVGTEITSEALGWSVPATVSTACTPIVLMLERNGSVDIRDLQVRGESVASVIQLC